MDVLTYRDLRLGEYSSGLPRRAGHNPMDTPPDILSLAGHSPRRTREVVAALGEGGDPSTRGHKDLRTHCLECSGDASGVRRCTIINCPLWPYRMGKNPHNPRRGKTPAGYWALMRRSRRVMSRHHVLVALDLVGGTVEREAECARIEAEIRAELAKAKPKVAVTTNNPLLETPKQLTGRAGISESQVRSLIASGRLEHVMIGSRVISLRVPFERFLQTETVKSCRDETKVQSCAGSPNEAATTSRGLSAAGAASARRARQIANG